MFIEDSIQKLKDNDTNSAIQNLNEAGRILESADDNNLRYLAGTHIANALSVIEKGEQNIGMAYLKLIQERLSETSNESNVSNLGIYIQIAANIVTAITIFFVWKQTRQNKQQTELTQEQMKLTLRPWIGLSTKDKILFIQYKGRNAIKLVLTNYGSIPYDRATYKFTVKKERINREALKSLEYENDFLRIIFPQHCLTLELPVRISSNAINNNFYFGFMTDYIYAGKLVGGYGAIFESYKDNRGNIRFHTVDDWT